MSFSFSDDEIKRIATVLGVEPKRDGKLVRFELSDEESGRKISLEILTELEMPKQLAESQPNNLVSIITPNSFLQLQGCTGFISSQELGEVIFVARHSGRTSGLVVEREAFSSLYAHVDERLLSTDFEKLPPEMIMSSVALSMTETLFQDLK
ncbi:MAG: hypothetical protein AB8G77_02940 [Rhodothermales bacterium]